MSDLGLALGRAMLALIFIISGFGKLTAVAGIAGTLQKAGFPQPMLFGYAVGALELVGGA
jgi:putative oxidoreductase